MIGLLCFILAVLASPFRSKLRLEAENAVLRHQLMVLRRKLRGRVRLTNHDRWFFIQLYRWVPSILEVLTIIQPETLVRWHRAGFRCYWRWKSRRRGERPQIETELRGLSRWMTMDNPLWAAPRVRGEPLLSAYCIVGLERSELVLISVTTHPTADSVVRQITEAFPWNEAPRYMIRDRDRIYGAAVTRRLRAMGIRDRPMTPASPWQNGFAER